jgi:hypothetical protein
MNTKTTTELNKLKFAINTNLWKLRADIIEVGAEEAGEWLKIMELVNEALNRTNGVLNK